MLGLPRRLFRQRAALVVDFILDGAGAAQRLLAATFCLLVAAPLFLVLGLRALADGCGRLGSFTLAFSVVFLFPGLSLAVPALRIGRLWLVWAAAAVSLILIVASGPTPISCPAWQR